MIEKSFLIAFINSWFCCIIRVFPLPREQIKQNHISPDQPDQNLSGFLLAQSPPSSWLVFHAINRNVSPLSLHVHPAGIPTVTVKFFSIFQNLPPYYHSSPSSEETYLT